MFSDITIEPFRGDYEELERMAHLSWRDEYGLSSFPNLYHPDYLRFLFERIKDKRHLITAYKGDEIISFFANLPRSYCFEGRIYRGVLSCLLVTRKEYLRKGLALKIINEALKLNEIYNYDFAMLYLETGHRSTLMINKLKKAGHSVEWVKKMYVIGRVLDLPRVSYSEGLKRWERFAIKVLGADNLPREKQDPRVREYRPEDLDVCFELLNQYQHRVRLARVWERDELKVELDYPGISKTLVFEKKGAVQGVINWVYHEHIGRTKERWAWLNHISYSSLSNGERIAFLDSFLRYVLDSGCVGVIEWTKGYYAILPLYRCHFFPYFRAVNMMCWHFNPNVKIRNIPDVYEVQI